MYMVTNLGKQGKNRLFDYLCTKYFDVWASKELAIKLKKQDQEIKQFKDYNWTEPKKSSLNAICKSILIKKGEQK